MKANKSFWSAALAIIGSAGVVATVVVAIKATPKAMTIIEDKKDELGVEKLTVKQTVQATWKCYAPTAIIGVSTIACIFGSTMLNRKSQASLASAYALLANSYKNYKGKLKELFGEETHNAVMDAIIKEQVKETHLNAYSFASVSSLDIDDSDNPDVIRTFYEPHSKRYFESKLCKVIEAEYHLNRNFIIMGGASVNELYDFLGLSEREEDSDIGWEMSDGMCWVDFNHRKTVLDDGMEVIIIDMDFEPLPLSE